MAHLAENAPDNLSYHTLLASIKLNQNRVAEAIEAVELALNAPDPPAHAYAVRGMALLRDGQHERAADDFRTAKQLDPEHEWAAYGLAACDEALERFEDALAGFRLGQSLAKTDEHRAACLLGQSRQMARLQNYDEVRETIDTVRELEPAADIVAVVVRPLARDYARMRQEEPDGKATLSMKNFIQSLAKLPPATRIELERDRSDQPYRAALLNGGFELGNSTYWNDASGAWWFNESGYDSTAMISDSVAHSGRYSLYVRGEKSESSTQSARTGQNFPVRRRGTVQVSVWVKAAELQDDALRLETEAGQTVLTVPAGTYDWRQVRAEFPLAGDSEEAAQIESLRLELISAGQGEAWIDDIEILCDPR